MSTSKRTDRRQWKKTLAVTGLVTGSLVLGTLGGVQAHADVPVTGNSTDSTTQAATDGTTDPTSQQVALTGHAAQKTAPAVTDQTTTPAKDDEPATPGKTETPATAAPVTQPEKRPTTQTAPASTVPAKQSTIHTPVTPATKQATSQQRAMPEALAVTTPAKATDTSDETIDDWMPDKNLQQIVLKAIQRQEGQNKETQITDVSEITPDILGKLTEIIPAYSYPNQSYFDLVTKITTLKGLEKATSLQSIHIGAEEQNAISSDWKWQHGALKSLEPIANLTNLKEIDFSQKSISDLTPLTKLTNLKEVHLDDNFITDISALKGKSNIGWLEMDNNKIKDISAIADMPNVWKLYLQNNQISDISPLAGANKLKELLINDNRISDIRPAYHNGKVPVDSFDATEQDITMAPVTLKAGTKGYTFDNPKTILDKNGQVLPLYPMPKYSTPKTGLSVDPDSWSNTFNWKGLDQSNPNDLLMFWNDGAYFYGYLHVPVTVEKPAPVVTPGDNKGNATPNETPVTGTETTPITSTAPATPTTLVTTTAAQTPSTETTAFKPFMIYTKDALNRYTQATFKENKIKKSYRKYTRQTAPTFKVVGVKRSANGHLRYLLSNGTYVTARKDFVANLYWQGKRYTKMRVDRTIYEHQDPKFTKQNRVRVFKQGKIVAVKRIIHRGYMTRYQLTNGHWITGNKQFITPVKKH